jgi:hypothetical protein
MANLKDQTTLIRFINSYNYNSLTYLAPTNIDGYTFYTLPIHSSIM